MVGFSAAAIDMMFGLAQYVLGRGHLAGRKHVWFPSLAMAKGTQAQTVKFYDDVPKPTYFGVNGPVAVVAGLAVMAATRWLSRTMHPVD